MVVNKDKGQVDNNDIIVDDVPITETPQGQNDRNDPIGDPDGGINEDGNPKDVSPLLEGVSNETLTTLTEDSLKTLLESKEGVGFDKDGNIVDITGTIISKFDDYKSELEESGSDINLDDIEEITIGETSYSINENGEAVDANGNVFKTKEEVLDLLKEQADSSESDEPLIKTISKISGFVAVDKDGNELEFEESPEGLAKREAYIVKNYGSELAKQELNSFFQENPDIVEMYNYKRIHGSIEGFKDRVDYGKITLDESNDDQHKELIISAEMARGSSRDRAEKIANYMVEDGKGKEEAESSLKYLKEVQVKKDRDAAAARQADIDREKAEIAKRHNNIATIVKSGKVNDIQIPEYIKYKNSDGSFINVSRDYLYQYMAKPVKDGKSQYEIDKESDDVSSEILDAYMRLTGFNYSGLIEDKTRQQRVDKLKAIKNNSKLTNKIVIKKKSAGGIASNNDIVE